MTHQPNLPDSAAVLDHARDIDAYGEQCRREGYQEGWDAAMAFVKREREEQCLSSGELVEVIGGAVERMEVQR